MRFALIAFFVVALAAVAVPQARRQRPPASAAAHSLDADQKAIADLQRRDIDANIALDTDSLMALCTDDIVYLVPGRPPLSGQDSVRKYLEEIRQQMANWEMVGYEETWKEARVVGDFAFEWGTVNIRAKKEGERNESAAVRNAMQILRREPDGSWKIARVIWNLQAPQAQAAPSPAKENAKD